MHPNDADHKKPQRLSREERRIQTRVALRDAALREFALCGVSGTSAERIAEAAGFTRGAFYSNFENKQSLLLDLISERIQSEQTSWIELADSQLDLDTLLTTLEARTEGFDPNGLWSLIASETYLYALRDPAFAADYRAYHEATRNALVRIVESLLRRAGKAAPMDIDEFCDAMLTLSRSVRLPSAEQPNEAPRPFARHLLMTLVRGMLAIAPPAP